MSALYASGDTWVGAGVRSVETGLEELFGGAPHRIVACAYSLGEGAFGLPERLIGLALDANAEVVLLVDRSRGPSPPCSTPWPAPTIA